MTLLTLQDAELAFGLQPLLDRANLTVGDAERIGSSGATAPASRRCCTSSPGSGSWTTAS
jgi:hypothetical protein